MDSAGGGAPWRGSRSQTNSSPGAGGPASQRGPPSQIQGAMMKDKKPFTYTPGGIDLSEIRSPRMAKRIQMNAAAEGVTSVPQPSSNSLSPGGGYHLPPASIAAMQPALPVAVFPQGGLNPTNLHRTHKPNDFSQQEESGKSNGHVQGLAPPPPPPPPPPPSQAQNIPPPPPERYSIPSPNSEPRPRNFKETHKEAAVSPRPSNAPPLSLASFMKQTIKATPDYDEDTSPIQQQPSPSQQSFAPRPAPAQSMNSQPEQRSPQIQVQRPVQNMNSQPQAEQRSPQIQGHRPVHFNMNSNSNQPSDERSPPIQAQSHVQNQPPILAEPRSQQLYSQRVAPTVTTVSSPQAEQKNHLYDERPGPSGAPRPYQQQRVEQKSSIGMGLAARNQPVQSQVSEPAHEQKIPMTIFQSENGEQSPLVFQQVTSPNGAPIYQHKPGKQAQQPSTSSASAPANNTKILNLGTLYIPPVQQLSAMNEREGIRTPGIQRNSSTESDSEKERSAPQTPQLNKAPTPWMNSRNKMPQQSSPSFASAGNTPWGKAKVIPINLVDNRADSGDAESEPVQPPHRTTPIAATPNMPRPNQAGALSNGARIIPIQIERTPDTSVGQSVRTPPTRNSRSAPYFMQNQKQAGEPAASNDRFTGNDGQWGDPTQSKSFRVLQKITSEDDASPSVVQPVSAKGQTIQIRVEPQMQPVAGSQQQYQFPVEYIAPEGPKLHPSQEKVSEPKLYMGKNIPSRSFKMLQQLTGEDGPSNSAFGSRVGDDHANISFPVLSLPIVTPNPSPETTPELGHARIVDINVEGQEAGSENAAIHMPEDFDPNEVNWDPSSYWYYWWYCASHFWNGREYEFPDGWEAYNGRNFQDCPEDVVYPFAYQNLGEDATAERDATTFEHRTPTRTSNLEFKPVLVYVPEIEETDAIVHTGKSESETCANRDETIETDKGHEANIMDTIITSPDVDGSFEINTGIVEEPETPTSVSDVTSPPITEGSCPGVSGLLIEECFSDDSEMALLRGRKRLSTIDELSENEKSLTAIIASISSASAPKCKLEVAEECHPSDDLSTSDNETSHASMIANKSEVEVDQAGIQNLNVDDTLESEQDEAADLNSAVSVRLPLTLSFSKSKSYRDVTTVLIGAAEVEEGKLNSDGEGQDSEGQKSSEETETKSDEYVSIGSLVINPSKEKEIEGIQAHEKEGLQNLHNSPVPEDKAAEVDFWSEIMKPHHERSEDNRDELSQTIENKDTNSEASPASDDDNESVDFWSVLNKESDNGVEEPTAKEANFWEESATLDDTSNFWDSSGNFQFSYEPQDNRENNRGADGVEHTPEAESCSSTESTENSETEEESTTESDTDDPLQPYFLNIEPSIKAEESITTGSIEVEAVSTFRQNSNKSDDVSDESKSSDERTIVADEKTEAVVAAVAGSNETTIINERAYQVEGQKMVITREVPINVDSGATSSCNCQATEKLARAENLLWRIEKFLQETLLLGSENDSGILTDISRQLSDYETDNDGEIEAVVSRRGRDFQPTLTQIESFTSEERRVEKIEPANPAPTEVATEKDVKESPVTLRGTEEERKARKYERAKTHSRLFELLQGDGKREDAVPEEEEPKAETLPVSEPVCDKDPPKAAENYRNVPITMDSKEDSNGPPRDSSDARSRLIPLPIKSNLTTSLSIDSNSSYSGSSSMLSPTSPNRDQILTDIVNQFQQRHQHTLKAHFNSKRLKHFPSKIFNILQQEFGQEFFDVFDAGDNLLPFRQQLPVELSGRDLDFRNIQDSTKSDLRGHKIICSAINATETKNDNEQYTITAKEEKSDNNYSLKSVSQSPKEKLGRDPRIPKSFKKL